MSFTEHEHREAMEEYARTILAGNHARSMFAIGAARWPGISKLVEEAGEVVQVCGKLLGSFGHPMHFEGSDLRRRLESELGDLLAAIDFVLENNSELSWTSIVLRRREKLDLFRKWHADRRKEEEADANHQG